MRIPTEVRDQLALRFGVLFPHLDERQQRLALATEARPLGHGGVRAVARTAGVSETTVRKGVFELEGGEDPLPAGRVRRCGGGRKSAEKLDPRLVPALLALVEPDERGDPMSPLRWTTKSLRHLAEELAGQGHPVSAPTVGRLLRENGFSLQVNAKTLGGLVKLRVWQVSCGVLMALGFRAVHGAQACAAAPVTVFQRRNRSVISAR